MLNCSESTEINKAAQAIISVANTSVLVGGVIMILGKPLVIWKVLPYLVKYTAIFV